MNWWRWIRTRSTAWSNTIIPISRPFIMRRHTMCQLSFQQANSMHMQFSWSRRLAGLAQPYRSRRRLLGLDLSQLKYYTLSGLPIPSMRLKMSDIPIIKFMFNLDWFEMWWMRSSFAWYTAWLYHLVTGSLSVSLEHDGVVLKSCCV